MINLFKEVLPASMYLANLRLIWTQTVNITGDGDKLHIPTVCFCLKESPHLPAQDGEREEFSGYL